MRLRTWMLSVAVLAAALALPAQAQTPFVAFTGQLIAEDVAPACNPPNLPSMFDGADEIFTSVFIPGELNSDPNFQKSSISVRNPFFAFAANVRTDAVINPNGALVEGALFDGVTLDPLGRLTRRPGKVLRLAVTPAYGANTSIMTVFIRMTNVTGIAGCTASFRGVFTKVLQ